jgi:two-component system, NarL family, nitrate/nitrite response regulator NarL
MRETYHVKSEAAAVRVVVGDDHPVFRDGVARGLSASGRVIVVGQAGNGREALAAIREHGPEVALLDQRMPDLDGISVARAVTREGLATRVLLLSAFTDGPTVYQALEAGAAGFLSKESTPTEIVDAVLAAARGDKVLPSSLAGSVVDEIRLRSDRPPPLSPREQEVLKLIADGMSVPAIAAQLHLAPTTIKTHVGTLYEKLGVSDRAAAVAEAMRRKLLE